MKRFVASFAVAVTAGIWAAGFSIVDISAIRAWGQDEEDAALDPIGEIALEMEEVVIDLSGLNTRKDPTQEAQDQIVGKLDELIARLEKECEACRGGSVNNNPNRPATDSTIRQGTGGSGDLHAARSDGKKWAELRPHQRDKITQSMTEGFPPHYQKILERYYRRLAEEKAAPEADQESEAADEPAPESDAAGNRVQDDEAPAKTKKPVKKAKST